MDSSEWVQGTIHEEVGMDYSPSPSGGDMFTCSRPLIERRLRPQQDQALKCPRCDSTHTKFCYYNNYSLSQPRYFCKTCRRYWTKGGTLRIIPVGGGCRKNKKVSFSKKSNTSTDSPLHQNGHHASSQNLGPSSSPSSPSPALHNTIDLHLSSFPDQMQFSHLSGILGNPNHYLENKFNIMLENPTPTDFMVGNNNHPTSRIHDFVGNGEMGGFLSCDMNSPVGINSSSAPHFHNFCPPFGISVEGSTSVDPGAIMLPYETPEDRQNGAMDVKPNAKLLSLEWHDYQQGYSEGGKDTFGYFNGVGSTWPGLMNGYGTSASNHLV